MLQVFILSSIHTWIEASARERQIPWKLMQLWEFGVHPAGLSEFIPPEVPPGMQAGGVV
jgi:hypothetical protein